MICIIHYTVCRYILYIVHIEQVKNPWMSVREKHILQDVYGNEICKMKKKLWALRYTWHMLAGPSLEDRRVTIAFR